MKTTLLPLAAALLLALAPLNTRTAAQDAPVDDASASEPIPLETPATAPAPEPTAFDDARAGVAADLARALDELDALMEGMAAEKVPLTGRLNELEAELTAVRAEFQAKDAEFVARTLSVGNLGRAIEQLEADDTYLADNLVAYIRSFESRLHIAEKHRYAEPLEAANLAGQNTNLERADVLAAQARVLTAGLDRLEDALGGARFEGTAVDDGIVKDGTFVLVGPAALFRPHDGSGVGTAEERLGSLEPTQVRFTLPQDLAAASALVESGQGLFPLDPTLGDAHKVAATEETVLDEFHKGGEVMYAIFAMAAIALIVALVKLVGLSRVPTPTRAQIDGLLEAVDRRDVEAARARVKTIKGPVGEMLAAGVDHLRQPVELVEEVMYEVVLTTRLKLERMLPFIAICSASAPLLGLLGTVTGIINTFKLITLFGSGDVKSLSGGISEALITTKYGLVVAIPSLLLHAFLSRKARGVINRMEQSAVALTNRIGRSQPSGPAPEPALTVPDDDPAPAAELVNA